MSITRTLKDLLPSDFMDYGTDDHITCNMARDVLITDTFKASGVITGMVNPTDPTVRQWTGSLAFSADVEAVAIAIKHTFAAIRKPSLLAKLSTIEDVNPLDVIALLKDYSPWAASLSEPVFIDLICRIGKACQRWLEFHQRGPVWTENALSVVVFIESFLATPEVRWNVIEPHMQFFMVARGYTEGAETEGFEDDGRD